MHSGEHQGDKDWCDLDLVVLETALEQARAEIQRLGKLRPLGVTVHSTTLRSRRRRDAYLSWLADIEPEIRRSMFAAIAEIERGTPLLSLTEWCSALRQHRIVVWLDLHRGDRAIANVRAAGACTAGFHLPPDPNDQTGPGAHALRDELGYWRRALHGQGMRFAAHGFVDARFMEIAGKLGVDVVTSDAHWPFTMPTYDALSPAA